MYNGIGGYLALWGTFSPLMFVLYEQGISKIYGPGQGGVVSPSFGVSFSVGSFAGFVAAAVTSPLDVVKTRMQTQTPSSITRYASVFDGLREIYTSEGPKALFRGTMARALNQGLAAGIMLGTYGSLRASMAQRLGLLPTSASEAEQRRTWRGAGTQAAAAELPARAADSQRGARLQTWNTQTRDETGGYDESMWPGIAQLSWRRDPPLPPASPSAAAADAKPKDPGWIMPLTRWD